MSGMDPTDHNPFTVLNLIDEDDLNILVEDCDIVLGDSSLEVQESWNEIKLEEKLRAAIAKAQYKAYRDQLLVKSGRLESENLVLEKIDGGRRGFKSEKGGSKDKREEEVPMVVMMISGDKKTEGDLVQQQKGGKQECKRGDKIFGLNDSEELVPDGGKDILNFSYAGGLASDIRGLGQ